MTAPDKLTVAYVGNRMPRHFAADLEDMVNLGVTGIVHVLPEDDFAFHRTAVTDMVRMTRRAGLEAWLDPWGVGGNFGFGAHSGLLADRPEARRVKSGMRVPHACYSNSDFDSYMKRWIEAAADMGATGIFWDEPATARCECGECGSDAPIRLMAWFVWKAASLGLRNVVCVHCAEAPIGKGLSDLFAFCTMDHVDELALSLVPKAYTDMTPSAVESYVKMWCYAARTERSLDSISVWPQAYQLSAGEEWAVDVCWRAATERGQGIRRAGIWSYRASEACDVAPSQPIVVWFQAIETYDMGARATHG